MMLLLPSTGASPVQHVEVVRLDRGASGLAACVQGAEAALMSIEW